MKRVVEGFESKRLEQALSYRAMSKSALASNCGISPSSITKYLNGKSPSYQNFMEICRALGFSTNFFLRKCEYQSEKPKLWRSLVGAHAKARKTANPILEWQMELHERYNKFFDLPCYDLGFIEVNQTYRKLDNEVIDKVAIEVRDHWGIGLLPMTNLLRNLERSGVVVTRSNLNSQKLDAVSTWKGNTPHILLNTFKNSSSRSRFDLAHELGHLLLHREVTEDEYKESFHEIEGQAHYFASSLLLPEKSFLSDVWAPTLKCFENIKPKWKTSIQAMIRRSLDLKAITQAQYSYLNINISRKGWRKFEPHDESIPPEKSRLFAKCLEKMEATVSRSEELESLSLATEILQDLSDLPSQYFETNSIEADNIIDFKSSS